MFMTSVVLAVALAADPSAAGSSDARLANCEIISIDDQAVPGPDAGVLTELSVAEGQRVTRGMEIGRVDDSEAKAILEVKQAELDAAFQKAKSDISIRHAEAAVKVADAFLRRVEEANRRSQGAVSPIEIEQRTFELEKSKLATEQSKEEQIEARLTYKAKKAEVDHAQVALERRILRAPFDGIVVMCAKKPGEWVAPGEAVVHVVGINRLRVMGKLEASQWSPSEIHGRAATVEVSLPRGRSINVNGKIIYVSPVAPLGRFEVWAEIETPIEDGLPVVRAGLPASMTIHTSQPVTAAAAEPPLRRTSVSAPARN